MGIFSSVLFLTHGKRVVEGGGMRFCFAIIPDGALPDEFRGKSGGDAKELII